MINHNFEIKSRYATIIFQMLNLMVRKKIILPKIEKSHFVQINLNILNSKEKNKQKFVNNE